jgi:N-acetylglucosamine kinase-like BadF-type ATPase
VPDLDGLVDRVYSTKTRRHDIAAFGAPVVRAAERGDPVAHAIFDRAVDALGEMARAVIVRAGWVQSEFPLVLAGGVFNGSTLMRRSVESVVQGIAQGARATHARFTPVVGAALEVLSDSGAAIGRGTLSRLQETLPEEARVP